MMEMGQRGCVCVGGGSFLCRGDLWAPLQVSVFTAGLGRDDEMNEVDFAAALVDT